MVMRTRHEWTDEAQDELDYYLAAQGNDHPPPPPYSRGNLHPEDVLWIWLGRLRESGAQRRLPPFK